MPFLAPAATLNLALFNLHFPHKAFINKVLACDWSHNPCYSPESQHFKQSLLLHQSDPQLKASNLPCISLINSEFPAFIEAPLGTSFSAKTYSSIVFSPQQANSLFRGTQLTTRRCKPTPRQQWQCLAFGEGSRTMAHLDPVFLALTRLSFNLLHIQN